MPNPNPADEKKEEKKDYLKSIRGDITSITRSAGVDNKNAADPYHKRNAYLDTLQTKLGAVAVGALEKEVNTGSLSQAVLTQKIPESKDPALNAALEAEWKNAQGRLLANANTRLTELKNAAGDEIKKLFNRPEPPAPAPPAFDEATWKQIFDNKINDFKGDIERERKTLIAEKERLIAAPGVTPEEKKKIEDRSTAQIAALKELEDHFVKEVTNQRDTAIYKAISETKIQSDQKVAPGGGLAGGDVLNLNQELTLAEHAERLRLAKLRFIYKLEEGKIWDTEELFDFQKHSLSPGAYSAYVASEDSYDLQRRVKLKFDITDSGIVFKQQLGTSTQRHFDQMLEVFYAAKKNREYVDTGPLKGALKGTISIEKHVTLGALQKIANAVHARRDPANGKDPVSLTLDDESIKRLLKQTRWDTLKELRWKSGNRNKPEDVVKMIVALQGLRPGQPEGSEEAKAYNAAIKEAEDKVKTLGATLREEAVEEKEKKHQQATHQSPSAKAKHN